MSWFCGAVALLAILTQQEIQVARALQDCTRWNKVDNTFPRKHAPDLLALRTLTKWLSYALDNFGCQAKGVQIGLNNRPMIMMPGSCLDVYRNNETSASGTYVLQNDNGEQFTVFCEFSLPNVYTYIKPTNLNTLNINDQFTDNSEFVLRYRLTNGKQFEEMIQQVRRYRSMNISFQYNTNSGFGDIQNTDMGPYLYVGFLPVEGIRHLFDEQGLSINGRDRIYVNCNGIPFSYFALLYNDANKNFNNYNYNEYPFERLVSSLAGVPAWYYRQTAEAWLYQGTRVAEEREFPEEFFSQFEVRFGGCGGYVTTAKLRDVTGITVGLKSDINTLTTPASTTAHVTTPPGNTAAPPPGTTSSPPGSTAAPPPGSTAAPPPGTTAAPPPGTTAAPPPGTTAAPPPGTTAAPPPGTTAAPPPGTTAAPPPGTTAAPPPGTTAAPPPGTTAAPPPSTTAAPPPGTTARPPLPPLPPISG